MFAEIKINNTQYTMTGNGRTMMILSDELKMDLFEMYTKILDGYSKKSGLPVSAKDMTALTYAFIKTANPDTFRDFDSFVLALTKPGDLLKPETINSVMSILFDLMSPTGEPTEEAKEETPKSKKKTKTAV